MSKKFLNRLDKCLKIIYNVKLWLKLSDRHSGTRKAHQLRALSDNYSESKSSEFRTMNRGEISESQPELMGDIVRQSNRQS